MAPPPPAGGFRAAGHRRARALLRCCYKSRRVGENLARVAGLQFEIVDFDPEDARASGELRAALAAAGTPLGPSTS